MPTEIWTLKPQVQSGPTLSIGYRSGVQRDRNLWLCNDRRGYSPEQSFRQRNHAEVTGAHTKMGDWRNGWGSDFHCNMSLLFTLQAVNRTMIYYIRTNTGHPSFFQITQWPAICLDLLFTERTTHLPQFDNVDESRPETIFTKLSSCLPCTTGRIRVLVNTTRSWNFDPRESF